MNDLTVIVGKRLARARAAQSLSTRQLAAKACVSPSTISRTERGFDAYFTAVVALAAALGLSLDELTAPTTCIICDGAPPRGFTCTSCRREGERPDGPDRFRTSDPEFWRHQPTEFA